MEDHRRGDGSDRQHDGADEQCGDAPTRLPGPVGDERDGPHHQRPRQVELLLDGEAPRVEQRRGTPHRVPVVDVGQELAPVGDVAEGGQAVGPDLVAARAGWPTSGRTPRPRRRRSTSPAAGGAPFGSRTPRGAPVRRGAIRRRAIPHSDRCTRVDERLVHAVVLDQRVRDTAQCHRSEDRPGHIEASHRLGVARLGHEALETAIVTTANGRLSRKIHRHEAYAISRRRRRDRSRSRSLRSRTTTRSPWRDHAAGWRLGSSTGCRA